MDRSALAYGLAGIALVFLVLRFRPQESVFQDDSGDAVGASVQESEDVLYEPVEQEFSPQVEESIPDAVAQSLASWGVSVNDFLGLSEVQNSSDKITPNERAFLEVIKFAEGTGKGGRDPYATCYAYKFTITNFADHPSELGVWMGERLSDAMCAGAGFKPGCVSTAAGAYQFIRGTWKEVKQKLRLPDFGRASQDLAALERIRQRGAQKDVREGRFDQAIFKCRKEWASLPGAGYGQGERSLAALQNQYINNGGTVA